MAALEIATFWGGELLFLDYVKAAPVRLGWTHDGAVSVHVQWVPDAERLQRKRAPWGELASAFFIAAVIHVGLLGLGMWVHESDPYADMPLTMRTLGTLAGDVEASGGGEHGTQDTTSVSTPTPTGAAQHSGNPAVHDPLVGPEEIEDSLDTASHFGMVGLLAGASSGGLGADDGWGKGNVGDLFGRDVPSLGPELSGVGQGGGGKGLGIGIGGIGGLGALCDDTCVGGGLGYGSGTGVGRMRGHHATVVCHLPVMAATVNKHLPPEVIQRIVRQNMGRFRGCYQDGLARNPSLEGRVQVKFMIGRDGAVSTAQDSGSSLPDASVVACIVGAYRTISFPESEGTTGVTYPLDLTAD